MKKIIVVVDDKGHRTAEMALSDLKSDFHFIGIRNPITAIEVLDKSRPNLVILTTQMPEMNSLEFLDALKQKSIRVPVVMVGSTPPGELVGEAGERGACHYIHMSGDESINDEVMDAVRQFSA